MQRFYYYAELNDNDVCVRIVSDTVKKVGSTKHIEILEYNPTVVYKKWLGDQWSPESYEPSVDTILQDKVDAFEILVEQQNIEVATLQAQNAMFEGMIMEMMDIIAKLTTPVGGVE